MQATQTLPQVVRFPQSVPAKESISQQELTLFASLRRRVKELQEQIAAAEESIQVRLESGAPVEAGIFKAFLKTTERRSVPWKQVCERELGEAFCTRVLAATKPDKSTHLIVEA